jgi:hypothetical protein
MVPRSAHDAPPFVVARTVVHVPPPQGATPSTHPSFGEAQVRAWARNPAGSDVSFPGAPAAGPASPTASSVADTSSDPIATNDDLRIATNLLVIDPT